MSVINKGSMKTRSSSSASSSRPSKKNDDGVTLSDSQTLIFISSLPLFAFLILHLLTFFPALTSGGTSAGITGIVAMIGVVCSILFAMRRLGYATSLLNVFLCVSIFTAGERSIARWLIKHSEQNTAHNMCISYHAAIDLVIVGYFYGIWDLGSFYPQHGEKYFATAYGVGVLGWDGVTHLFLQSILCYRSLRNQDLGNVAFVWSGSVINSMMPLLIGAAATGRHSADVQLSTSMNGPYIFIPIVITYDLMTKKQQQIKRKSRKIKAGGMMPMVILVVTHTAFILLHVLRTMASLNSDASIARVWRDDIEPALRQEDGTNVLLVQSFQSFFYLLPYHCLSLYEVYSMVFRGKKSFLGGTAAAAWSSLVLGAYLQSSFTSWFMTVAEYRGPGDIVYKGHDATAMINGAVVAAALCQQQLLLSWLRVRRPKLMLDFCIAIRQD